MEPQASNDLLPVARKSSSGGQGDGTLRKRRRRKRASDRAPEAYATCDALTGWLVHALAIFTPWAFGSTESWAVRIATALALALGGIWLAKLVVRAREEYTPPRWGDDEPDPEASDDEAAQNAPTDRWVWLLGIAQTAVLVLILASLVMAPGQSQAPSTDSTGPRWLPGTLDRDATLEALIVYLGLVGTFWATRDWLLYRSARDKKELEQPSDSTAPSTPGGAVPIPGRLRRLLWLLCLNGALLAICGFLQRASGTNLLLWVREMPQNSPVEAAFGPWPYHQDAAHYFNLLWPVCLAFWLWMQERSARMSTSQLARIDGPQLLLLPCAIFMAACPAISPDRNASLVSLGLGAFIVFTLLFLSRRQLTRQVRLTTIGCIVVAVVAAASGGWQVLRAELTRINVVHPTGITTDSDPFTLFLRLRLPSVPPREWTPLVHLRGDVQGDPLRQVGTVGISPAGELVVQFSGKTPGNPARRTLPDFTGRFGDKEVLLAVCRTQKLRVYVDGVEIDGTDDRAGSAASWMDGIGTGYLQVVDRAVKEVALIDTALDADEVGDASRSPLTALNEQLNAARPVSFDPLSLTNALEVLDGAGFGLLPDPQKAGRPWIEVRRFNTPGRLGFQRSITNADPRLHGTVSASFVIKNTPNSPLNLLVSMDGGDPTSVEVPARIEREFAVKCRVPHDGPPRFITLDVGDGSGNGRAASLPGDARLLIRDLRISPGTTSFNQIIDPESPRGSLNDRLGGHPEVRATALRAAASNPFWGTGAGTFAAASLKFAAPNQPGSRFAHNDWLQTRATLGWTGTAGIALGLAALLLRSWFGRGLQTIRVILALIWAALAGCLISAASSFPLQLHPVLVLFTIITAMTTVLAASRARA